MRRGTIIVLVFVVLAGAVIAASQFLRSQPPLEITVAVSPLAETWLRSAVEAFNASDPIVNTTRRVHVTVNTVDDLSVWSDEGQRAWAAQHPTAWIPASSASIAYANRLPLETVAPSLAQTMLVWGGFSDRVDALTDDGARPLDWAEIVRAADAGTWAAVAADHAAWGNIKLAFTRPNGSTGGLAVLFSGAGAFADDPVVSGATVVSNDFHAWMQGILLSVPNYNTLGASVAKTLASRGISVGEIALLPESEWLTNLSGNLTNASNPIRLSYPAYQFVFDFPLARWGELTTDEDAAVEALHQYLLGQNPEAYGLRPVSGAPAPTARLWLDAEPFGAQLAPDLTLAAEPPPRAEVQRMLVWVSNVVR
ncbi:MAG: hypothetical protein IT319_11560 [Anaerolineae bacterium]|nr:hypothetical protein [Anaerolineae bacterium]